MRLSPTHMVMLGVLGIFNVGIATADPLEALAKKLAKGTTCLDNKKIAVLTFPYHDDKVSTGSTLLSERLTTFLVVRKGVRVLERSLIQQLLNERKLTESGVVDPSSFKAIGKILDAEAVVSGTLIDLSNATTEINARLIRTDTGEVLSAGRAVVPRTWDDSPIEIIRRAPSSARMQQDSVPVDDGDSIESFIGSNMTPHSTTLKKLSNENFPPGRRRYLSNENHPSRRSSYNTYSNSSGDYESDYNYVPSRTSYPRSTGYNGTDHKPLPPTTYGPTAPLGTVRTEQRTYSNPVRSSTKSKAQ